jgi:hypothetical protein
MITATIVPPTSVVSLYKNKKKYHSLIYFPFLAVDLRSFNALCDKATPRGRISMALLGIDTDEASHVACEPDFASETQSHPYLYDIDMVVMETQYPPCMGPLSLFVYPWDNDRLSGKVGVGAKVFIPDLSDSDSDDDQINATREVTLDYGSIPNICIGRFGYLGRFKVKS